jgi:hypothetical protein
MLAPHLSRLALAFDRSHRVAEPPGLGRRSGERVGAARDEPPLARHLGRSLGPAPVRRFDAVAGEDRAGVADAGGVRRGRARADILRRVADHVRNRQGHEPCRRRRQSEPAALEPRQMAADAIDLPHIRPGAEQGGGQALLLRQSEPVAGQAGQRRGAAAEQHQDEVVRTRLPREAEQPLRRRDAGFVRHRMGRADRLDPRQCDPASAPRDREARQRPLPLRLDDGRHLSRRLAERQQHRPPRRRRRQMRREHPLGQAGLEPRAPDRFQMLPRHGSGLALRSAPIKR